MVTGSEEGPATGRGHLRAAHADREYVVDLLKAAYVAGRLTRDELGTRTGRALTARTYADLAALTADLPDDAPAARPPRPAQPRSRPARPHPVRNTAIGSAACLTVAFLSFWYGASLDDSNTPVFLWLTLFALLAVPYLISYAVVTSRRRRSLGRQLPPLPSA